MPDMPRPNPIIVPLDTWEPDRALDLIKRSLSTPNGVTVPFLKLDPGWDPLRSDPRFQQLIAQPTNPPNEHG